MLVRIIVCLLLAIFGTCLCEFVQTPENTYFASKESLNWTEAKRACLENGLELVSVLNKKEKTVLETFLKEYNLVPIDKWNGYWLAGIRYPNGTLYWDTTGTKVGENIRGWLGGEPNNSYKREHCVELKQDWNELGWNDYFCDEGRRYLCQRPRKEGPQGQDLKDYGFLAEENDSYSKYFNKLLYHLDLNSKNENSTEEFN